MRCSSLAQVYFYGIMLPVAVASFTETKSIANLPITPLSASVCAIFFPAVAISMLYAGSAGNTYSYVNLSIVTFQQLVAYSQWRCVCSVDHHLHRWRCFHFSFQELLSTTPPIHPELFKKQCHLHPQQPAMCCKLSLILLSSCSFISNTGYVYMALPSPLNPSFIFTTAFGAWGLISSSPANDRAMSSVVKRSSSFRKFYAADTKIFRLRIWIPIEHIRICTE